ncbi:MAG TPA: gamma-glutamyltransferase [Pyrinomonadaceae bacterium]|nr:gamma-glutamyltransferase [Pyrinomonadaceae bacterium]
MNFKRQLVAWLLASAFVCAPVWSTPAARANAWARPAFASREPVRAPRGMVASTSPIASRVGVEVMRRGGNAVDAAVAVAFALAVTYPAAGNLGGGGFMMIRLRDGRATAIDYREMAPASASRNMYLDANGNLIQGAGGSLVGYRASGVPGTVAGMELALKKYGSGRLTWAQLVEPARRLAAEGFEVNYGLARSLRNNNDLLERFPDTKRILLKGGRFYNEGERLVQPELAATFARLKLRGAREFYEGRTAQLIAADMRRHGGTITLQDLRNYVAKERAPLRSRYREHEVISMPPPSSGGAVLIETLNILEGFDLRRLGASSSERYHLLAEAMRRSFADRAEYMGDADFVHVPVAGLIDKEYAARLRRTIDAERASSSAEVKAGRPAGAESEETTHFTVVDAEGNAVSNTYTLNGSYGSGVIAEGTGVLLNNEMDDFAAKPGTPNMYGLIQSERNAIAPRKRPLSAMTPTFVLRRDGSFWLAVGSPGGPTIINTVLQVVTNVIDHEMNIQQAVDAPRIHHQWLPDEIVYEPYGLSADTFRALERRGHKFTERPRYMGDAHGIMIEEKTGVRLGASDPRNYGEPAGY